MLSRMLSVVIITVTHDICFKAVGMLGCCAADHSVAVGWCNRVVDGVLLQLQWWRYGACMLLRSSCP